MDPEKFKLIDWEKPDANDFVIVEEVTLRGNLERRPDLVLYINGIAVGAIYALVALGIVLIYKATEVLNFAHGDLLVVSAFSAWGLITVWALPNNDLHTTATRRPCSRASMTARSPAPPAPITTTSYSCRSSSAMKITPVSCE